MKTLKKDYLERILKMNDLILKTYESLQINYPDIDPSKMTIDEKVYAFAMGDYKYQPEAMSELEEWCINSLEELSKITKKMVKLEDA